MTEQEIDNLTLGVPTRTATGLPLRHEWINVLGLEWPLSARIRRVEPSRWEFSIYQQMTDIVPQKSTYSTAEEALEAIKNWLRESANL